MEKHKFRLVKISSPTCVPCVAMAKAKTLEKFEAKYPEVQVESHMVSEFDGEEDKVSEMSEAEKEASDLCDQLDVQSFPTIIFFDAEGKELVRADEALGWSGLVKLYESARLKADKVARKASKSGAEA